MQVFEKVESEVRSYCRSWPTVFTTASGSRLKDESGKSYIDFFAGAGSLNYGHNHPVIKQALLDYLAEDNIIHGLDKFTVAKRDFLETFDEIILTPRQLDYKVMFPGPAGNNAVEAALKLARKYTGRETVISFTNGFHGMTLGALAVTGNSMKRGGAGVPLNNVATMPFDNYMDGQMPDFLWLRSLLEDSGSGLDQPAAVIVETVQGEGGINVASDEWLRGLQEVCREYGMLLIVDDIQMGCGRTGPFFSFERAGIQPDIVTISKSLSGLGMPFALTMMKRELDVWEPGEHNGTFRGFNPAFVTATAALEHFWRTDELANSVHQTGEWLDGQLKELITEHASLNMSTRGQGLARGLVFENPEHASKVCSEVFQRGLLMESAGAEDEVVKFLPPLTTSDAEFKEGIGILADAVEAVGRNS
ncbi:diaminobutyrate--2-oxoglutarate transaminase [Natronoglycomyces albus]|uniref:Diaminobutyrate--2-oxoglutarate transaminase n=1 Tax=Natronoglycomyces albus TaxID=2811108 RepID=A0A895XSG7_9ACTN|nr:diaminobutyrate--2-oxoglutarate transaminase [Natronoglycomyces albus]QSB04578.1 diaminobutyrate--2-oxoglutarate transaminase [Natronoglycomyces albus]